MHFYIIEIFLTFTHFILLFNQGHLSYNTPKPENNSDLKHESIYNERLMDQLFQDNISSLYLGTKVYPKIKKKIHSFKNSCKHSLNSNFSAWLVLQGSFRNTLAIVLPIEMSYFHFKVTKS